MFSVFKYHNKVDSAIMNTKYMPIGKATWLSSKKGNKHNFNRLPKVLQKEQSISLKIGLNVIKNSLDSPSQANWVKLPICEF